jgi:hypothetical protein
MDRMNKNHLSTLILNLGFLQGTSVGRARDHLLGWGTSNGGEGGNHLQGKRTIFREHAPFARRQSHLQREGNHFQWELFARRGEQLPERGTIRRERNSLEWKGTVTKKEGSRVVGRVNHFRKCKEREPFLQRREPLAERGNNMQCAL